jgi:hypothetical protein
MQSDSEKEERKSKNLPLGGTIPRGKGIIFSRKEQTMQNTLTVAIESLDVTDHPLHEHTELGWDGNLDELAMFMLVESITCYGEDEQIPIFDERVSKIGLSFRAHPSFKSVLHLLYLSNQD